MPSADIHDAACYRSFTLYVVDYVSKVEDASPQTGLRAKVLGKRKRDDGHQELCDNVCEFFATVTEAEIKRIELPENSKPKDFIAYWDKELANKTKEDLIFIWFEGVATGYGENYFWHFRGYPKKPVNAFKLLNKINDSGLDCMMLLDCDIATRLHGLESTPGNLEILARGSPVLGPDKKIRSESWNFTLAFLYDLAALVDGIDKRYKGWKAPRSIAEMIAADDELKSNPIRVWLDKPKAGTDKARNNSKKVVQRIKLDPKAIRESDPPMIEFFSYGTGRERHGKEGGNENEGVGEVSSDEATKNRNSTEEPDLFPGA